MVLDISPPSAVVNCFHKRASVNSDPYDSINKAILTWTRSRFKSAIFFRFIYPRRAGEVAGTARMLSGGAVRRRLNRGSKPARGICRRGMLAASLLAVGVA